jgi:hypothetical protein
VSARSFVAANNNASASRPAALLTGSLLTCLVCVDAGSDSDDEFAVNGKSPGRILRVLKQHCSCKRVRPGRTAANCFSQVSYNQLLAVCTMFWTLTKCAQDTVLWSLQNTATNKPDTDSDSCADRRRPRLEWNLDGGYLSWLSCSLTNHQ